MKVKFYAFPTLALLAGLAMGCSTKTVEPATPTAKAGVSNFTGTSTYYQFRNLPAYMTEAVGYRFTIDPFSTPPKDQLGTYALSNSPVPGGYQLYYSTPSDWNGPITATTGTFNPYPGPTGGGVIKFAFNQYDGNGSMQGTELYAITSDNKLWAKTSKAQASNNTWNDTGFLAADVAVSQIRHRAASIGESAPVYFLGAATVYGGHRIYALSPNNYGQYRATEIVPGAAAVSLAVDMNGRLWAVNSLHEIFVNPDPSPSFTYPNPNLGPSYGKFALVPGKAISIASSGSTLGLIGERFLNHGYEIFLRDANSDITQNTWKLQPGDATKIGGGSDDFYYLTNDLGELFLVNYQ